jgi:hypothetical protein
MRTARLVSILCALVTAGALATPVRAAAPTFYVDGKVGSDSNNGLSAGAAFKTIAKAAFSVPAGSAGAGSKVLVKGYPDYVYRERPIPTGWGRTGTASAPIVFQALGYVASSTSYVKPIVSGADRAPAAGNRWTASSTSGVWYTPWSTAPFDFGKNGSSSLPTAIFQDTTTWLWEQPSLSALGGRAAKGKGGYWYDSTHDRLYVSAVSTSGSTAGTDPGGHQIDVPMRSAFLLDGRSGGDYVQVRGFEVRHSGNGIAYLYGADRGTVADNVLIGNIYMGISVSGYQSTSGPDPADGMTIWRNRGSWNTIELIKLTSGVTNASVCYNDASFNGLAGILVEGPPSGSSYTGKTSGVTLCSNKLHNHAYNPTGTAYNNAAGALIQNGALSVTVRDNLVWGNDVGIHVTQGASNMPAMNGLAITRNQIWGNRRFGLYFLDGYRGSGAGTATASYDLIWGNGIGVMVDRGSKNKTLSHETVYDNDGDGIKVGGYQVAPASVAITRSLVTGNGGYGLWLVTGNSASLSYTGFSGNARGNIAGSPSKTAVNTQAPGYLSTLTTSSNYLRIGTSSYQYTAGPGGTPIGAKY